MKQNIKNVLNDILKSLNLETEFDLREPPQGLNFDLSTNIPLRINKIFKKDLTEISELVIKKILKEHGDIFYNVTFTKPGFINFNLKKDIFYAELLRIVNEKELYPVKSKKQQRVLIEFVSSNPTGPLHIGHGRCAVIGDVLANILSKQGYEVFREYYVNDRGRQINILTASVINSIKQKIEFSSELTLWIEKILKDGEYKGTYINEVGKKILCCGKMKFGLEDLDYLRDKIVETIMEEIKDSLEKFNVKFDNYYSENSLYNSLDKKSKVDEILELLEKIGLIENNEGALWFKSKDIGDDKDRVIKRSNGEPTYFLSDIAYHITKLERGYNWLINIWGTDHHGYVQRLRSALKSVVDKEFKLDIILYQLVSLLKDGARISMSTREGKFITLTDVINEVGVDVTRYFLLTKTPNTHLDFDFNLAKEHSLKNPVYYIQYAHTRCCGILREAKVDEKEIFEKRITEKIVDLKNKDELELIKKICFYEDILDSCLETLSAHPLCIYLLELSKTFHKFYESCRIIETTGKINYSRAGLVYVTKIILNNGLRLLGLSSPEKM